MFEGNVLADEEEKVIGVEGGTRSIGSNLRHNEIRIAQAWKVVKGECIGLANILTRDSPSGPRNVLQDFVNNAHEEQSAESPTDHGSKYDTVHKLVHP
jgi:hypothetical protein